MTVLQYTLVFSQRYPVVVSDVPTRAQLGYDQAATGCSIFLCSAVGKRSAVSSSLGCMWKVPSFLTLRVSECHWAVARQLMHVLNQGDFYYTCS